MPIVGSPYALITEASFRSLGGDVVARLNADVVFVVVEMTG